MQCSGVIKVQLLAPVGGFGAFFSVHVSQSLRLNNCILYATAPEAELVHQHQHAALLLSFKW